MYGGWLIMIRGASPSMYLTGRTPNGVRFYGHVRMVPDSVSHSLAFTGSTKLINGQQTSRRVTRLPEKTERL